MHTCRFLACLNHNEKVRHTHTVRRRQFVYLADVPQHQRFDLSAPLRSTRKNFY